MEHVLHISQCPLFFLFFSFYKKKTRFFFFITIPSSATANKGRKDSGLGRDEKQGKEREYNCTFFIKKNNGEKWKKERGKKTTEKHSLSCLVCGVGGWILLLLVFVSLALSLRFLYQMAACCRFLTYSSAGTRVGVSSVLVHVLVAARLGRRTFSFALTI